MILFVDADDEVAPGYIDAMAAAVVAHQAVAARLDVDKLNAPWVQVTRVPGQQTDLLRVLGFLPFGLGCSLGVSREALAKVGGFAEDIPYAEDVDFCWRLALAGFPLRFVPEAVVHQRYRSTFRDLFSQSRRYGRGQVCLYRKYRSAGMPRRSARALGRDWLTVVRRFFRVRTKGDWARWVHRLGYRVGRVQGSIHFRALYL